MSDNTNSPAAPADNGDAGNGDDDQDGQQDTGQQQPVDKAPDWQAEAKRWEELAAQREKRAKRLEDQAAKAAEKAKAADEQLAELEQLRREKMTAEERADHDRKVAAAQADQARAEAVQKAAEDARTEVLVQMAGRLADAELRAGAASAGVPEIVVAGLLPYLDRRTLLNDDLTEPDPAKVAALVQAITPPPAAEPAAQRPTQFPDLGQGRRPAQAPIGIGDDNSLLADVRRKLGIG